jgi:hypothetical protein
LVVVATILSKPATAASPALIAMPSAPIVTHPGVHVAVGSQKSRENHEPVLLCIGETLIKRCAGVSDALERCADL